MNTSRAMITHARDAPAYWQIGNLWRVMATGVQTGNSFCLLDQILTGGRGGPQTHTHIQDEGLYVISGQCTFNAGGKHGLVAPPGTFAAIPRLTEHSFTVDIPETQILNFYLPAGFEQLLIGIAHPADRNELPPPGIPLPPPHLVDKLAADYGQYAVLGMPFKDPPDLDKMYTKELPGATEFPFLANAKDLPALWIEKGLCTILASAKATGNSYSLIEQLLAKGATQAPHVHEGQDEVFYILDGEITFLLGDRVESATKGALVFIPRGKVHGLRVDSETTRFLNLHTPGGMDRLLTALGEPAKQLSLPPADFKPKVVERATKFMFETEIGLKYIAVGSPF